MAHPLYCGWPAKRTRGEIFFREEREKCPRSTPGFDMSEEDHRPLLALLAIAQLACAQTTPAPANAPSTPQQPAAASTLQSNVTEVSLDLVVRDKKNRLVPDLTTADFTVTDDGAPVKLSNLHLAGVTQSSSALVSLVFDHLDPAQSKNAHPIAAKLLKSLRTLTTTRSKRRPSLATVSPPALAICSPNALSVSTVQPDYAFR